LFLFEAHLDFFYKIDESDTCKLADFGLSRFLSDGKQSTLGKVRGTYAYCCPEVCVTVLLF
jgi:hypothetical protein